MACGFRFRISVGLGLAATLCGLSADERPAVELIAVEPNTGGSSGGHAGLRIGGSVYHFMAGSMDSLLLLYRVSWEDFKERYCELENRGLALTKLDVAPSAVRRIESHFKHLLAVQDKHTSRLAALDVDRRWLASLADGGEPPELPGRGFFDAPGDPFATELQTAIAGTLGDEFLERELALANEELLRVSTLARPATAGAVDNTSFPEPADTPAEALYEILLLREALLNIQLARGLDRARARAPDRVPLAPGERQKLDRFCAQLETSVVRLLKSPRPDRGKPLMLATARWLATRTALAEDRMVFLDSFPPTNAYLDPGESRQHRELLEALRQLTARRWSQTRKKVFAGGEIGEFDYHRLEVSASRAAELANASATGESVRITGAVRQIPSLAGAATPADASRYGETIAAASTAARAAYEAFREAVDEAYGFHLIKHNCATELAGVLLSAFPDEPSAAEALGGLVRPGDGFSAIPVSLTGTARERWNVASESAIPSRRKREVEEQLAGGRPLLTRLRESNRLTSRVYPGSIDDDAFLFFADGRRALRPIQGAANFTFGLAQTGAGVATAPFDEGRRLARGARGLVWSVPEVFGVSIRKGHYDLLPGDSH